MAEKVEIIIEAEDNASGKIEDVGGALESLSSTAMKENLMDLKKSAAGAFDAIGNSVGQLVDIAAEDELVMVRLDAQLAALGDTAKVSRGDIENLAEQLSKITGFDDEALVEGQTTLLRFGNLSKEQFEQATRAAADLAAMTGMDLVSAFRQVGIALDNPEQGFGRLKRQIGDLTVEQQAAIDAALEMGDTMKAQALILDALSMKVDGAGAMIGDTFSGKVNKAQVEIDNLKSSIGNLLIEPLPQWMVTTGMAAKETGNLIGPVVDSLADLGIVLMTFSKFGGVSAIIASIGAAIKAAFTGAAALIGGISLPVLALIAAIGLLIFTIIKFGKDALATLKTISMAFDEFKNLLLGRALLLVALMPKYGVQIGKSFVDGIWDGIKTGWSLLTNSLDQLIDGLIEQAKARLGISSPSKMGIYLGEMFTAGIGKGMTFGAPALQGATSGVVSSMLPSLPASGGRGSATINITYAPAISAASPQEFEAALVPMVDSALRRVNRRR